MKVAVDRIPELQETLLSATTFVESDEDSAIKSTCNDMIIAMKDIQESRIDYLSDSLKSSLADGLETIISRVCVLAYTYYTKQRVEVNEETTPLLRQIVEIGGF